MKSSQRDRKIKIQKPTATLNLANEEIITWSTFATPYANKKDRSGGETFDGAVIAFSVTDWNIRFLSGLTEEMRVKYEDDIYSILNISEIGRRKEHVLRTEKQDHGYNT
jgi:SPP1 family predicted phage head-tail adaptor